MQGLAQTTADILARLERNAPEYACIGKCSNVDIIPIEEHRPSCFAVINEKKQRLRRAGVGERTILTLLGDLKETKALKHARDYLEGSYKSGSVLILAGSVGVGKTVAASYVISQVGGISMYSPDLQEAFVNNRCEALKTTNFLLIDDFGVEYKKEFLYSKLDALIHHRHKDMRATIITTNLTDEEFKEEYKGRISSRIREWGYFVNVLGEDMRENRERV